MASFIRKLYSPIMFDIVFTAAGAVGTWGMIEAAGVTVPAIEVTANPLVKGLAMAAIAVAALLLAIFAARCDQSKADDYIFRTLTMSALVGQYTFVFATVAWLFLLAPSMGGFSIESAICLWLLSWALGYLYTRLRGTGAAS